jgi:hypothetical protein
MSHRRHGRKDIRLTGKPPLMIDKIFNRIIFKKSKDIPVTGLGGL